jgi:hypothetical protein
MEQMTLKAPEIQATVIHGIFNVSTQGEFGFDENYVAPTNFLGGTAASELGLSSGEALQPSPGGLNMTQAEFMTAATTMLDQHGAMEHYSTIFSNVPGLDPYYEAWSHTPAGQGYRVLKSVIPG